MAAQQALFENTLCSHKQYLIANIWGRQEHYTLIEDLTFKINEQGKTYLTYAEDITKTQQSGLHEKHHLTIPKMFETMSDLCSISMFYFYISKRPIQLQESGPL